MCQYNDDKYEGSLKSEKLEIKVEKKMKKKLLFHGLGGSSPSKWNKKYYKEEAHRVRREEN